MLPHWLVDAQHAFVFSSSVFAVDCDPLAVGIIYSNAFVLISTDYRCSARQHCFPIAVRPSRTVFLLSSCVVVVVVRLACEQHVVLQYWLE